MKTSSFWWLRPTVPPPFGTSPADYPVTSFYFKVRVGNEVISFKEVSGITREMETEELREGGENTFVYRVPKGVKQSNLTLKRCLLPSNSLLYAWCVDVLERGTLPLAPKTLEVQLLQQEGKPVRAWSFYNAYPVKWEIEKFDSQENKVAVESMVLCYTQMLQHNST